MKVKVRVSDRMSITPECFENFSGICTIGDIAWIWLKTYPNPKRRLFIPLQHLRSFYHGPLPENLLIWIEEITHAKGVS